MHCRTRTVKTRLDIPAVGLSVIAVLLGSVAAHADVPFTACSKAKIACASAKVGDLLACHQKAEGQGVAVDPACIDAAVAKFSNGSPRGGCWEHAEASAPRGCFTTEDAAAIEVGVDRFVADVVGALDPQFPAAVLDQCGALKKRCVARKVKALLACYGKAAGSATFVDPACLAKVRDRFEGIAGKRLGCFEEWEAKFSKSCQTVGDAAALEALADAFARQVYEKLTPPPELLDFTLAEPGDGCGQVSDGGNAAIETLLCGGLDIGGGQSFTPGGLTPGGATSRFARACKASICAIGPTSTVPAGASADPDCTDVGCAFGMPLPIPNIFTPPLTLCAQNTWSGPASGTLNLISGNATLNIPLAFDQYLTGNLAQPCPICSATGTPGSPGTGTCDRGPRAGQPCTSTNPHGLTRDCPTGGADELHPCTPGGGQCLDGAHVGVMALKLAPLITGTETRTKASGLLCTGQTHPGCFGLGQCRSIVENGQSAGPITVGIPAPAKVAGVFCVAITGNGLIDSSADLPAPAAASLPGTFLALPAP